MAQRSFKYDVEHSELDPSQDMDSRGTKVTTIQCHGSIVAETRSQIDDIFQKVPFKGRLIFDLADVDYVDSSGLGALMRLKLHAMKEGGVSVKFEHMAPRVMQLLSLANLTEWFSS